MAVRKVRRPRTLLGEARFPVSPEPEDAGWNYLLERDLLDRLLLFFAAFFAGRRFAVFFTAFLAGLVFRAAFLAAEACFFLAGARFTGAAMGAAGMLPVPGIVGVVEGMAGLAGAAAGILIASSHPGVNISSRSREMALARPQRGHLAS